MRTLQVSVDSGEFELATRAAEGLGLTLTEFAGACLTRLARESAPASASRKKPTAKPAQAPAEALPSSWLEAVRAAEARGAK